jgi:hypothetical protein
MTWRRPVLYPLSYEDKNFRAACGRPIADFSEYHQKPKKVNITNDGRTPAIYQN